MLQRLYKNVYISTKFLDPSYQVKLEILRNIMAAAQQKIVMEDYSMGVEELPIPLVNEVDDEVIQTIDYRPTRYTELLSVAVELKKARDLCEGCTCEDNCMNPEKCECQLRTIRNSDNVISNGYTNGLLLKKILTGVYECNKFCRCSKTCPNRVSQHGIKVRMQVFKTLDSGWGVRALTPITKGTFIANYTGSVITNDHFSGTSKLLQILKHNQAQVKQRLSYLAFLGDLVKQSKVPILPVFYVDAATSGNITRLFNHSCEPNMFAQYVFKETHDIRLPELALFAKKDIEEGEQLCWDYGYKPGNPNMKNYCKCGSKNCRGKIF